LRLLQVNVFTWPRRASRSLGAGHEVRPTIRARCAVGDSSDGTPGIFTLRRFTPDAGCEFVSKLTGLHAVHRVPRRDLFSSRNRPSNGGIKCEKGRAIMSLRFGFQASTPVIDPHSRAFLCARADPALGFASFRFAGIRRCICTGTTPCRTSASVGRFRPLSAHGFVETAEMSGS